ncbi:MAG: glycosyltransferase family 39 protein [Anaerolineae bacterium]
MPFWRDERVQSWLIKAAVGLIVLVAFAARLLTLGQPSLWFDEGVSVLFASKPVPDLLATVIGEDLHPPAYYLLLHFWMALAGKEEFSIRFLSVLFGVLLIPLTFATAREVYRGSREDGRAPLIALPAAALVGFSPFLLYYSQEARMYSVAAVLSLAAILTLLRATRLNSPSLWVAHGLFLALGLYTHYFSPFIVPAALVYVFLVGREAVGRWLRSVALAAVLVIPWLGPATMQLRRLMIFPDFWPAELSPGVISSRIVSAFLAANPSSYLLALLAVLVGLGSLVILRNLLRRQTVARRETLIILAFIVPVALTSFTVSLIPKFAARYAIVAVAPLYIGLLIMLYALLWRRPAFARLLYVALVALAIFVSLNMALEAAQVPRNEHEDTRSLARYLNKHVEAEDAILLMENAYHAFVYYYHGAAPWYGLHIGQDFVGGTGALNQILATKPKRIWMVLWHHEFADPTDLVVTELLRRGRLILHKKSFRGYELKAFELEKYDPVVPYPTPQVSLDANFAGTSTGSVEPLLTLRGFDVIQGEQGIKHYVLYWEARQRLERDYSLTLTLEDGDRLSGEGNEYLRLDQALSTPYFVPAAWPVGTPIRGRVDVELPLDLPAMEYQVRVKVYDPVSRRNLDVLDQRGAAAGKEVLLERVRLSKGELSDRLPPIPKALDRPFAAGLKLRGYQVKPASLRPGDPLTLTLWWEALGSVDHEVEQEIRLTDAAGHVAHREVRPVVPGYPVTRWGGGEINRAIQRVYLPASLPGGQYRLQVGLDDEFETLTTIEVQETVRSYTVPHMQHPVQVDFGGLIELLGYDLSAERVRAGETITVTLYWRARQPIPESYKVTAQLLSPALNLVAQDDSLPARWSRPTTGWLPGEVIVDPHTLRLKPGVAPGRYTLIVALYHEHTGERLRAVQEGVERDHGVLGLVGVTP